MADNKLYYGDNLDVLYRYVSDEPVDLVYLDPPFKSEQDYNMLFAERNGTRSAAQIRAFEDTWRWDRKAAEAYQEVVEHGGRVSQVMQAFRTFLGENDLLAYLSMMAPRLVHLHRVLKPTGSIYLHCDPTASHYLKLLMDAVFGPVNFRNEIIWKRSAPKSHARRRFASAHDVLLFYAKSDAGGFNASHLSHDEEYIAKFYRHVEEETGRRYTLGDLVNPNKNRPNLTYEFKGVTRVWRWTRERMEQADREGRIVWAPGKVPRYKRYLDEMPGTPATSVWTDISPIGSHAAERLGYQTQKPEALLERIILASSNEGDVVLDPFCGCGTTVAAAQKLNRRWVGIDITSLAIALIKKRLRAAFGEEIEQTYQVIGEPVSVPDAEALARQNPFHFQCWALGLVEARPTEGKRGADRGIDGRLYFDDENSGKAKQIVFSVKSGRVSVADLRDLRGVVERERAEIGVLITLQQPTRAMRSEAAAAGFWQSPGWNKRYPRIQILTVRELVGERRRVDYPRLARNLTYKAAPKARRADRVRNGLVQPGLYAGQVAEADDAYGTSDG